MFNTVNVNVDSVVSCTKEIREIKAPTDESARLLHDLEAKAEKSIIERFVVSTNSLSGAVIFTKDHLTCSIKCHAAFSLNNRKFNTSFPIRESVIESCRNDGVKICEILLESLSKEIAKILMTKTNIDAIISEARINFDKW
jgi:hypothetical protein